MSSVQNAPSIRYRYDALDRLISHRLLNDPERRRFYCENRLATETEGVKQLSIVQHGDQLLAQKQHQSGGVKTTLLATDLQRSVLDAIQTDSKRTFSYSPYGHGPFESVMCSVLGFNGQRPDPVTGHYLLGNGYRAFNSVLMRFNSPDNLSPFDKGGMNAYAYCAGDPVNRRDPAGHFFSPLSQFLSRVSAQAEALKIGIQVKPVKNVTRLSEGIFTFEDVYKGRPRLTFEAHGLSGGIEENINGFGLLKLAGRHGVHVEKFDSVRTVICHSADRTTTSAGKAGISFAEGFSRLVGRPVKAYEGVVGAIDTPTVFEGLNIGETYGGQYYFGVAKKDPLLKHIGGEYRPVTFQSSLVRNVRNQ